jgi:hypothetical protein
MARYVKMFEHFVKETETSTSMPGFSIHDRQPGDEIEIGDTTVKIVEFLTWVKDKEAICKSFKGEVDGKPVIVRYEDTADSYVIQ